MRPGAEERDDAALLRAVARGDEEALAALYDRHAGWLTVRMTRRCAMPDVVDHAIQDTFLALWREAGAYRGGGDVAAFIWGIGVRRLIDVIRRENGPRRLPWRAAKPEVVVSAEDQVLAAPVLAVTCWAQLRIMAHTIPPHTLGRPTVIYPLIAQLTGWSAVTAAAAAWYAPGTSKFLVEPPATALGVTLAWYAIASAALILTCASMRDGWHRYSHDIHRAGRLVS